MGSWGLPLPVFVARGPAGGKIRGEGMGRIGAWPPQRDGFGRGAARYDAP